MIQDQAALHMLIVLTSFFVIPPLLSLIACTRRRSRVVQHGGSGLWPLIGMIASVTALLINLTIFGLFGTGAAHGMLDLNRIHLVALGLSWICLWIWIVVALGFRRRRVIF